MAGIKLLELVKQKAAEDATAYEEAMRKHESDLIAWANRTSDQLGRLVDLSAADLAGMFSQGPYHVHERMGIELPPTTPNKPNHTTAIRQLELAATLGNYADQIADGIGLDRLDGGMPEAPDGANPAASLTADLSACAEQLLRCADRLGEIAHRIGRVL